MRLAGKVFVDGRYAVGRPAQRHGHVPDRVVDGGRDGVRGGRRRRLRRRRRRRQQVVGRGGGGEGVVGGQQASRECGPVGGRLRDHFPSVRRHQIQIVVHVFRHVVQHGHRARRRRRHVATIYLGRKRTDLEIGLKFKIRSVEKKQGNRDNRTQDRNVGSPITRR